MAQRLTMNDTWGMAKSALTACKEHNETTNKLASHVGQLWNEIGAKNNKISELRDELQEKQNDVDYYSDQNSELLTQVNNLEDELKKLKGTEVSRAQYEKRFRKFINDENVDN